MHVDQVLGVVGHDIDPVVNHTVSAGAIPLQVLDVRGRVHELEPLGDAEQDGPANASKKEGNSSRHSEVVEEPDDVGEVNPAVAVVVERA